MANQSEAEFQRIFVQMFNFLYPECLVSLSLSGVPLLGSAKQKSQVMYEAKRAGLVNGLPDLTLYLPNAIALNMEFKRPDGSGKQSDEQILVEQQLNALGHTYYVIDNYELAWSLVSSYTSKAYRIEQFNKLTTDLPDITTEQFMFYPAGTNKSVITGTLKQYYHI